MRRKRGILATSFTVLFTCGSAVQASCVNEEKCCDETKILDYSRNYEENIKIENDVKKVGFFKSVLGKAKKFWQRMDSRVKKVIKVISAWYVIRETTDKINKTVCFFCTKELREAKGKPYKERVKMFEQAVKNRKYNYSPVCALLCSLDNLVFLRNFSSRGAQQTAFMYLSGGRGVCRTIARQTEYFANAAGVENHILFHSSKSDGTYHLSNIFKSSNNEYKSVNGTAITSMNDYASREKSYFPKIILQVSEELSKLPLKSARNIEVVDYDDFKKCTSFEKYPENKKMHMSDLEFMDPNIMSFKLKDRFGMLI